MFFFPKQIILKYYNQSIPRFFFSCIFFYVEMISMIQKEWDKGLRASMSRLWTSPQQDGTTEMLDETF